MFRFQFSIYCLIFKFARATQYVGINQTIKH